MTQNVNLWFGYQTLYVVFVRPKALIFMSPETIQTLVITIAIRPKRYFIWIERKYSHPTF